VTFILVEVYVCQVVRRSKDVALKMTVESRKGSVGGKNV
jgi:hypothetical protein